MLIFPAVLTHDLAAECARGLKAGLRSSSEAGPVVADASALQQFDSSALAVLLDCRRDALALGRTFLVRGLPPRLRQLAGLYGVAELIPAAA